MLFACLVLLPAPLLHRHQTCATPPLTSLPACWSGPTFCRLIRQQDNVIDGGGIAHAHYKLQLWPGSGDAASGGGSNGGIPGSSAPPPSAGATPRPASSSRSLLEYAAGPGAVATDELWVSPPANFVKGNWDEENMEQVSNMLLFLCTYLFCLLDSGTLKWLPELCAYAGGCGVDATWPSVLNG